MSYQPLTSWDLSGNYLDVSRTAHVVAVWITNNPEFRQHLRLDLPTIIYPLVN